MKQKQVFHNAKWIILCKIAQSILQLIVGMISARYLGPSNYGLISYASSIVAFALPLMKLGLDAILVHELVEHPEKEGEIMGTSLGLNVSSGLLCIFGVSLFATVANFGESETIIVCALYSISVFFAALEMIQYWFQYKLLSKYSSMVMLVAYILVSAYKIYLLISAKSVYWFSVSHSLEYGFIALMLFILYYKKGGKKLSFSFSCAKRMFSRSKHYIWAALMVIVIQNVDHIMLTAMVGTEENGYYSAAITTAGIANFVYSAVIDSFRPLILSAKKENQLDYEMHISRLYGIVIYLSLAESLAFTILAPFMIQLLYGADYVAAIPVLQILIWYCAFSFMGGVRNIWLLAEEKYKYLPWINLTGVALNVTANLILIPLWGACGAAVVAFFTQFVINFALGFIIPALRENNMLLLKGLNPVFVAKEVKKIVLELIKKE